MGTYVFEKKLNKKYLMYNNTTTAQCVYYIWTLLRDEAIQRENYEEMC